MKKKVFLGGTCTGWDWRHDFIQHIKGRFDYLDTLTDNWNEEAEKREIDYRNSSDLNLYIITPYIKGIISIWEVCEDALKNPEKTIFAITRRAFQDHEFDSIMMNSLESLIRRLENNGVKCFRGNSTNCFLKIIRHIEDHKTPFQKSPSQFKLSGTWNLFKCFTPPPDGKYLIMIPHWKEPEFAHYYWEDKQWYYDFQGQADVENPVINDFGETPHDLYWTDLEGLFKGGKAK